MSIDAADLRTLLKARLEFVREDLFEAMGRLQDEDLHWAPKEGMRTIGGQLMEILATERQDLEILHGAGNGRFKEIEADSKCATVEEYKAKLKSTRAELVAFIDGATDEELQAVGEFPEGWFETMGRKDVPISEAIRSVAQHEWYHTAQLVSYLWMRGDNPYEWS